MLEAQVAGLKCRGWRGSSSSAGAVAGGSRGRPRAVFSGGVGEGEGVRIASTALRESGLARDGAVWRGLKGLGRIRAGRNRRPDGHTARSEPSFRSITSRSRGERCPRTHAPARSFSIGRIRRRRGRRGLPSSSRKAVSSRRP